MSKSGKARIFSHEQFDSVVSQIQKHRHPQKNSALVQVSFKLGLRVQEISLLQIKEVARLSGPTGSKSFKLLEIMSLPASYTKGSNAVNASTADYYSRRSVRFSTEQFDKVVHQITALARAGADINPEDFYPPVEPRSGKTRDLPMVDQDLRDSLEAYLTHRLIETPDLKPTDTLFLNQKRNAYSPNSLQRHFSTMYKHWGGIEKASSHSGRRSLADDVIHGQGQSIKVAQDLLGHKQPSTTVIYTEANEEMKAEALRGVGEKYRQDP